MRKFWIKVMVEWMLLLSGTLVSLPCGVCQGCIAQIFSFLMVSSLFFSSSPIS